MASLCIPWAEKIRDFYPWLLYWQYCLPGIEQERKVLLLTPTCCVQLGRVMAGVLELLKVLQHATVGGAGACNPCWGPAQEEVVRETGSPHMTDGCPWSQTASDSISWFPRVALSILLHVATTVSYSAGHPAGLRHSHSAGQLSYASAMECLES